MIIVPIIVPNSNDAISMLIVIIAMKQRMISMTMISISVTNLSIYLRGHTNPPHPHTSDLINLNDLNCSEESSVLRAFSELLHLINSNLNLLNGWWWGWGGFVWSQYHNLNNPTTETALRPLIRSTESSFLI